MTQAAAQPANRFARIFKWLMLFCALVWVWGFALVMAWPWHKGGDWLPEFPLVVTCAPDKLCILPYGELAKARAEGRLQAVQPPLESGEAAYQQINVTWDNSKGLIETTASAWNFQITVRYRIENDQPVMVQYREISIKLFFYALAGALFSTIGLFLRQLRN